MYDPQGIPNNANSTGAQSTITWTLVGTTDVYPAVDANYSIVVIADGRRQVTLDVAQAASQGPYVGTSTTFSASIPGELAAASDEPRVIGSTQIQSTATRPGIVTLVGNTLNIVVNTAMAAAAKTILGFTATYYLDGFI